MTSKHVHPLNSLRGAETSGEAVTGPRMHTGVWPSSQDRGLVGMCCSEEVMTLLGLCQSSHMRCSVSCWYPNAPDYHVVKLSRELAGYCDLKGTENDLVLCIGACEDQHGYLQL